MYCSNCGQSVSEGAKFCSNCGNAIKPTTEGQITIPEKETAIKPYMTSQQAIQLRSLFAKLGHKIPDNPIARNYNDYFRKVNLALMNPEEESVIVHLGIMKHVSNPGMGDKLFSQAIKGVSKEGKILWEHKKGELVITNKRLIILTGLGMLGTPSGVSIDISNFKQVEQTEYSRHVQFIFYGRKNEDVVLEVNFQSIQAVLGQVLQVTSAFTNKKTSGWIDYLEKKENQQGLQSYINAHLMNVNTVKQAFAEVVTLLVNINN